MSRLQAARAGWDIPALDDAVKEVESDRCEQARASPLLRAELAVGKATVRLHHAIQEVKRDDCADPSREPAQLQELSASLAQASQLPRTGTRVAAALLREAR